MTAQDIIDQALSFYNVFEIGGSPSTAQRTDGLTRLQNLVDAWQGEDINLYTTQSLTATLTGAATYTFGVGGTFSTTRPIDILDLYLQTSTVSYPIPRGTVDDYANFALKQLATFLPAFYYYDAGFPTATLYLAGIPNGGQLVAVIASALTTPAALNTTMNFPPVYSQALIYNLAVLLGPPYGQPVDPNVRDEALRTKGVIQSMNLRTANLTLPMGIQGGDANIADMYWWKTGGLAGN